MKETRGNSLLFAKMQEFVKFAARVPLPVALFVNEEGLWIKYGLQAGQGSDK